MKSIKIIPIINMSSTSKMPCPSFSLPAQACKVGAKLAKIPGSVCHGCYALKGAYRYPNVKAPRADNLASLPADGDVVGWTNWAEHMADAIGKSKAAKVGFFRWHDSGDLQSFSHLEALVLIAHNMPNVRFWLPTKEKALIAQWVRQYRTLPHNLTIRVSAAMVDGKAPTVADGIQTSTVHKAGKAEGFACNAPSNGGKCGECRACWDKSVSNVSYAYH